MYVIIHAKDAVVPMLEVVVLLEEDMEFLLKEPVEVAEHESRWGLIWWFKVAPVKEGLDCSVWVVVTEVGHEGVRARKGWCKAGRDTA